MAPELKIYAEEGTGEGRKQNVKKLLQGKDVPMGPRPTLTIFNPSVSVATADLTQEVPVPDHSTDENGQMLQNGVQVEAMAGTTPLPQSPIRRTGFMSRTGISNLLSIIRKPAENVPPKHPDVVDGMNVLEAHFNSVQTNWGNRMAPLSTLDIQCVLQMAVSGNKLNVQAIRLLHTIKFDSTKMGLFVTNGDIKEAELHYYKTYNALSIERAPDFAEALAQEPKPEEDMRKKEPA